MLRTETWTRSILTWCDQIFTAVVLFIFIWSQENIISSLEILLQIIKLNTNGPGQRVFCMLIIYVNITNQSFRQSQHWQKTYLQTECILIAVWSEFVQPTDSKYPTLLLSMPIVYAHGRRLCSNWFWHGSTAISYPQCSLTFMLCSRIWHEPCLHRCREQSLAFHT